MFRCISCLIITPVSRDLNGWNLKWFSSIKSFYIVLRHHGVKDRSHCDWNLVFCKYFSMPLSLQCKHLHLLPWYPFFRCHCHHNWSQNPFSDDIKIWILLYTVAFTVSTSSNFETYYWIVSASNCKRPLLLQYSLEMVTIDLMIYLTLFTEPHRKR